MPTIDNLKSHRLAGAYALRKQNKEAGDSFVIISDGNQFEFLKEGDAYRLSFNTLKLNRAEKESKPIAATLTTTEENWMKDQLQELKPFTDRIVSHINYKKEDDKVSQLSLHFNKEVVHLIK